MSDSKKIDYIQEKVDSVVSSISSIDKELALQKAAFEAHTRQDEEMYGELKRMNDILQQNTESLKEHMQNNMLLKDMIAKMDERLDPIERQFIEKNAVKEWVSNKTKILIRCGKVAGALVAIVGAWVYLKPIIEHLISHM